MSPVGWIVFMKGLEAEAFRAGKAYNTNAPIDMLEKADITAIIPPVKSRKERTAINGHVIRRRRIVTRYAKLIASLIAAIHVRCLFLYILPSTLTRGAMRFV
jgi:hypothetical protein